MDVFVFLVGGKERKRREIFGSEKSGDGESNGLGIVVVERMVGKIMEVAWGGVLGGDLRC